MATPLRDLEKFHAERRTGIGSSDMAAICGEDGFKTAYQVALEKAGMLPPDPAIGDAISVRLGLKLEDDVAEIYQENNLVKVHRVNQLVRSPEHEFIILHPDRRIVGRKAYLEVKTSGVAQEWGKSRTSDQIPNRVLIQVQHYCLADPETEYVDVACLMFGGGERYREYHLPANAEVGESLIEIGREFWTNLQQGILPEPDWPHPSTPAILRRLYPGTNAEIVHLKTIEHWHSCWKEAAEKRLGYEKLEQEIKNHLLWEMGRACVAPVPGQGRWVRRIQKRKGYVVEPSEFEEFRFLKDRKAGTEVVPHE